jgi:hypothetical protein
LSLYRTSFWALFLKIVSSLNSFLSVIKLWRNNLSGYIYIFNHIYIW